MAKRFGPTRGAGVVIIEQEGEKTIEPGALGWAGYAGVFEKGKVGELILASSKKLFSKKMGGIVDGYLTPDCALDFYDGAGGAGGLALVRVTDGNERQAQLTLYQRNSDLLTPMGTVKAANGGRWGGKRKNATYELDAAGDLNETTLQLPAAVASNYNTDEWKGGYIELSEVPNSRYPIVGNNATGLITVESDQTMKTDWTAGGASDLVFYLVLETEDKAITVEVGDGEDNPDSEFSLSVFVDGEFVKKYGNLHTDPDNARYWVNVINNDDANDEIFVVDLITGAHTAAQRPANYYGEVSTVTALVLTAIIHDFTINSPSGGDPTFALGTTNDAQLAQKITITMTSATAGDAVSDKFGALGTVTLGTLFDPPNGAGGANVNKWAPSFTVTAGGTALVATDTLVINYKPFIVDELIGGYVYPNKVDNKLDKFRISDNTHSTITISSGDMTTVSAAGKKFLVQFAQELADGADGNADLTDTDYIQQAWDLDNSPFNQLADQNLGLVKFATPGIGATAVAKAAVAYVEHYNHQYRHEIPSNIVTEQSALSQINDTLGRSDFSVVTFPSYVYVLDPNPAASREGKLKLVPATGMIHGAEAAVARDYNGYHKAEAGINVKLPKIIKLTTDPNILDQELLNPAGIGMILKKRGNYVLWGDRTLHLDPTWRWKHQRELMSYYEQVLYAALDFIIFTINDADSDNDAKAALISFFLPEWTKRAIRGDTFGEAAIIKVDSENNTDATRAAGDKNAAVSLRLADTTERFIITMSKQGVFENVSS